MRGCTTHWPATVQRVGAGEGLLPFETARVAWTTRQTGLYGLCTRFTLSEGAVSPPTLR